MGYLTLKKNFFNDFIAQLSKISKVVAPVSKGFNRYEFTEVHSGKEISMEYIPTSGTALLGSRRARRPGGLSCLD